MPYIIRPRGVRNIVATLLGTTVLVAAAPAVASAAECPSSPANTALAQFGDNALYSLLSGSSFEAGAAGWSLENAQVVSGGANGGSHSLLIGRGGVAVSPAVCVSSEEPTFRFFARQVGGWRNASLNVSLRWTEDGFQHSTTVGSIDSSSQWTLSPALELATALPLSQSSSTLSVNIAFQPSWGSTWAIDDVYIDPYSR